MSERTFADRKKLARLLQFVLRQYAQRAVNGEGLPNARFTHR